MSLLCLAKHTRLLKASDYNKVFEKSVRSSDHYFTVLARPNDCQYARLGMAFTKKIIKLAITRNRLKRISRESFRLNQDKFRADYVVLAGTKSSKASNKQLFHSLEQHWQQLYKKCVKL